MGDNDKDDIVALLSLLLCQLVLLLSWYKTPFLFALNCSGIR